MVGRVVANLQGDGPWRNLSLCTSVWTCTRRAIDIATADIGRDGEVRHVGSIGGDLKSLDKALRKLTAKGHRLHVVYEAGPCGFVIWRHLSARWASRATSWRRRRSPSARATASRPTDATPCCWRGWTGRAISPRCVYLVRPMRLYAIWCVQVRHSMPTRSLRQLSWTWQWYGRPTCNTAAVVPNWRRLINCQT